jgi:hypothetical protein
VTDNARNIRISGRRVSAFPPLLPAGICASERAARATVFILADRTDRATNRWSAEYFI